MFGFICFTVTYLVGALVSDILLHYVASHQNLQDFGTAAVDDDDTFLKTVLSIIWPAALLTLIGYFTCYIPAAWVYKNTLGKIHAKIEDQVARSVPPSVDE